MAFLSITLSSPVFQGFLLELDAGDEKIATLEPILQKLPFDKGYIQLGSTEAEMPGGKWDGRSRSCASSHQVKWNGKQLNVMSDVGAPGAGAALTDVWNELYNTAKPIFNKKAFNSDAPLVLPTGALNTMLAGLLEKK